MGSDSIVDSSKKNPAVFWPWLVVLLVLLLVGFIRLRLLEMPLERDEGEYAYAGQLILQGVPPYELAYNMKLPGTYLAYALGMAFFGQTTAGVHSTLMVVNSLTIILVFLLGRKLFGTAAGLAACASYGIMSVSPAVLGMAAHANHFVNLFAVPATLLLWQAAGTNRRTMLFFSGLLYGLAFIMKQPAMFICLFGWLFLLRQEWRNKPFSRAWLTRLFIFGSGMILPFALICLWLALAGVFHQFWFWTFDYARAYISQITFSNGMWILGMYLGSVFDLYAGFLALAIAGLLLVLRDKTWRNQVTFVLGWSACSFLAVAVGFHFWRNYFILILPAFAILTGMAVGRLQQFLEETITRRMAAAIPLILFLAVSGWNLAAQRDVFFQMSGNQICQAIYPGQPFVEAVVVADYIQKHSAQDARVAVLGSEPQIYFNAHRRSATGYIYTYALTENQPFADKMQQQMIGEIETNRPAFLVRVTYEYSWATSSASHPAIYLWSDQYVKDHYQQEGLVGVHSSGEIVSFWNDEEKTNREPVKRYLAIYRRKN
jgi:4-amino-4-deoxy-L-arabinose transferase-like glycosyltransferase